MLTSAGKKEHLFKNFSYWLLLANSEYREIFKSIYYEEHLQTAASENVFMKLKKKLFIKSLSQHFEKEIYQYVNIILRKRTPFSKKTLLVAASYWKTPVLKSLLVLSIAKFLKAPTFQKTCPRLLLKMCSWNWEKLKFIRSFNFTLKNQYHYSTSISETSENVCFYFVIGFPWSLYSHTIFLWCGEK